MIPVGGFTHLIHPRIRQSSETIRFLSVFESRHDKRRYLPSQVPTFQARWRPSAFQASRILLNGVSNHPVEQSCYPCDITIQRRFFASKRDFQLDALPFSISPEEALQTFERWAVDDQGLRYLLQWKAVRIGASYVPVWSFDINIRFVTTKDGRKRYDWKPEIFAQAYGNQPVINIPGIGTYAGYSYRRSLVNPIVNTTLVFMGDKTMPFEKYMLRDMQLSNGARLEIFPDPWNATRGRALSVIRDELEAIAQDAPGNVKVQTEVLGARRVYIPTYIIDYSILGAEYRAFVSGCDVGAGVSGVSHKVFGDADHGIRNASNSFLSNAASFGARIFGGRGGVTRLIVLFQLFGSLAIRLLSRLPLIGAVGGVFVGFRKIVQPWMDNRSASAHWERQREYESIASEHPEPGDDFVDNGSARQYFQENRAHILGTLSGEHTHQQGQYDWYKDWEEWARKQWEQQQQQQTYQHQRQRQQTYGQQQQQQQQTYQRKATKEKPKSQWDFDPNDPYSVLGLKRGATKSEVSAAFRREMLKHHPDTQANASDAAKERATERSKIITDAYRKIKSEMN